MYKIVPENFSEAFTIRSVETEEPAIKNLKHNILNLTNADIKKEVKHNIMEKLKEQQKLEKRWEAEREKEIGLKDIDDGMFY